MFDVKKIIFLFFLFFLITSEIQANEKIKVVVSIPPLLEMAEAVGGQKVNVNSFIPVGANPHVYEPRPEKLKEVSQADIFIKLGTGIEAELMWLDKLAQINKKLYFCDSSKGIVLKQFNVFETRNYEEKHQHQFDPHIWTSLKNAIIMVENIKNCFVLKDPNNAKFYEKNALNYIQKLKKIDKECQKKFSGFQGKSFLVFHPTWAYFACDYGLKEIPLEIEGKEPKAKDLANIIKIAQREKIKVIFVSPWFSQKFARAIAEQLKIKVVELDNLAKNYLENIKKVSDVMVEFLR